LGSGPIIVLGAHYDTRPIADEDPDGAKQRLPILGANDGASGPAVLMELARVLDEQQLQNEVWLAFLDGGDWTEWQSTESSGTYLGSSFLVESLGERPVAFILVNMVGDSDQQLYYDSNSDPALQQDLWTLAEELGYLRWFVPQVRHSLEEDHLPWREIGIPVVAIQDFDYDYWHTMEDTADKISPDSLERVGRLLEVYLEQRAGR
jgi:hypothetical protein